MFAFDFYKVGELKFNILSLRILWKQQRHRIPWEIWIADFRTLYGRDLPRPYIRQ